jgi:hypothetical protein
MLEGLVIGLQRLCKNAMNVLTIYCAVVIIFKPVACFRVEKLNISNKKN